MRKFVLLASLAVTACGTGQIIPTGADTYSVTSSGAGFSTDGVKADVYAAANDFCAKQSREMVEVSLKTQDGALGRNPPSADLKFRCLVKGDPEIERRTTGVQLLALPIGEKGVGSQAQGDYAKIKQLKELLDSGAITQKEYDDQKAKILSGK